MPVMHRGSSAPTPTPTGPPSLEDLLRDAAAFAETEEVPEGLAFRALSRQIAAQDARKRRLPAPAGQRSRVVLWLGGLSAGTLAGASAAVLLMAHVNGNSFRIPPTALPVPVSAASTHEPEKEAETSPTTPIRHPEIAVAENQKAPVKLAAAKTADCVPTRSIAREKRSLLDTRIDDKPCTPRRPAPRESAEPSAAQWKTETVDETAYQLVTTAYVADSESGSDKKLTPVQMQICLEPTESVTETGVSGLK